MSKWSLAILVAMLSPCAALADEKSDVLAGQALVKANCAPCHGNENTNGLIRQYLPKGTNFKNITNNDLAILVKKLNHRPRKCLDYQTPHEVIHQAIDGAFAT